jgi:hypothetical protein
VGFTKEEVEKASVQEFKFLVERVRHIANARQETRTIVSLTIVNQWKASVKRDPIELKLLSIDDGIIR